MKHLSGKIMEFSTWYRLHWEGVVLYIKTVYNQTERIPFRLERG